MWEIRTTIEFKDWLLWLDEEAKVEIYSKVALLELRGPLLKRPHADTLNGSHYANMKELRVSTSSQEIRIAFAFDPLRKGILLIGGDKVGVSQKQFYKKLITKADELYTKHLNELEDEA